MSWTDKVGEAFSSFDVPLVGDNDPSRSAIGAAYTAAADSVVGEAIGAVAKPALKPVMTGLMALNYPLDRTKRGLSTFGQVLGEQHDSTDFTGPLFDSEAWSEAWKNSEDVSAGQVLVANTLEGAPFDIGQPQGPGRFSPEMAKQRDSFFKDTWSGKLSSGAVDVYLDFAVDPLVVGGKIGKAANVANKTIKSGDVAAAVAASTDNAAGAITKTQAKKAGQLQRLYETTDGMTASQMMQLPAFRKSGDAGAIAHFFESANKEFAGDSAEMIAQRYQTKADIFGAVLGDTASIQAVKDRSAQIAEQIQRMGEPPATAAALAMYKKTDFGKSMIDAYNAGDAGTIFKLTKEHEDELGRLHRVLAASGSSDQLVAGPLEKLGYIGRAEKLDQRYSTKAGTAPVREPQKPPSRALEEMDPENPPTIDMRYRDKLRETILPNGLAGKPIRAVLGLASTRVQGAVHLKDETRGFDDLLTVVSRMRHTPAADRRGFMDEWVNAATDQDRRAVVDKVEERMFKDAAAKYGVSEKAAKKLLTEAGGRRSAYNQGLKDRLYSTADPFVTFYDPEDDLTHVFERAFLQTHIENTHNISDPHVIDQFLKRGTNKRMLERWAEDTPLAGVASTAADLGSASRDTLDNWGTMATRAWKDSALMRGAYPLRIQVDTQMRLMAHLGMMKYFMDGKTALGRYWLTDKEGQYSIKNFFKEGNYEVALEKQLTGARGKLATKILGEKPDTVNGVPLNPAIDNEDVRRVVSGIASEKGAAADIGNDISGAALRSQRKDGSWGKTQPHDPNWFEAWTRVAHQIRTSPTARAALENDDIEYLKGLVHQDPKMLAEWNEFKDSYPDGMDDWLRRVIANNDQYFPTPELRRTIRRPEDAKELFDLQYPIERKAALPGARAERVATKESLTDIKKQLTKVLAEHKAAAPRSAERKELKAKADELRAKRAEAQQARQTAKDQETELRRTPSRGERTQRALIPPMPVHGESFSPLVKNTWGARWENFRNGFYNWAADAPETIMGRSPIYVDSYKQYIKDATSRLGEDGIDLVGVDRIRASADRAARKEVANVLFDATHTSNLSHAMRFLSPFFSAWEDTIKKWGKLMANDPSLPPTLAKAWNAPANAGLVQDQDGRELKAGEHGERGEYIIIPKLPGIERLIPGSKGEVGNDKAGAFKIRRDSINILFQGTTPLLPGVGPLVQIPANELVRRSFVTEADNPVLKYILPFGVTDDSIPRQLLPGWAKQARDAFGGTKDYNQQYVILMNQELGAWQRGERKTKPSIDEINGKTKMWFILRAGLNNVAPVSIQPVPKDQFYIDKAREYKADPKRKDWQQDFYDDFPGYFEMSATLSVNETGLNATNDAQNASQKYKKDIRENPKLGWFFAGPDNLTGEFNPNVNTYQRSTVAGRGLTYRSTKDPDQAVKDTQAAKGWVEYNKFTTLINAELDKRGVNIDQKAAEDLAGAKSAYVEYLSSQNSAWALAYLQRDSSKVEELWQVASTKWKKDREFAKRPDQVMLKNYFDARSVLDKMRETTGIKNEYLNGALQAYGRYLASQSPSFEQIYNRVLEADNISQKVI